MVEIATFGNVWVDIARIPVNFLCTCMCIFIQKLYQDKLGEGLIELLKDSGAIDASTLNPTKVSTYLT